MTGLVASEAHVKQMCIALTVEETCRWKTWCSEEAPTLKTITLPGTINSHLAGSRSWSVRCCFGRAPKALLLSWSLRVG